MRILIALILSLVPLAAFELPPGTSQCIVGIAPDWDSSKVTLQAYEKRDGRWQRVLGPWPGRLGREGLVWGLGLHPKQEGKAKREGDWRAPAGVFRIGGVWGYESDVRRHPRLAYRQVTPRDLWVEDAKSEHYNRHLVLDHEPRSEWERKQQMRQGDHAHSLKLFVAHNAPPRVSPGAGSAIFFHIWRGGGSQPTAGCTTLSEERLRELIAWIDPTREPVYVLMPEAEYRAKRAAWKLP